MTPEPLREQDLAEAYAEVDLAAIVAHRNYVEKLKSDLTTAREELRQARERFEGHGKPCYYCGEATNDLDGNPGMWSICLSHSDEPGVAKWHHEQCVNARLQQAESLAADNAALREVVEMAGRMSCCLIPGMCKGDCINCKARALLASPSSGAEMLRKAREEAFNAGMEALHVEIEKRGAALDRDLWPTMQTKADKIQDHISRSENMVP